jgi:hypothetical protein
MDNRKIRIASLEDKGGKKFKIRGINFTKKLIAVIQRKFGKN